MIPLFICEADPEQRSDIEKIISDFVIKEAMDIEVMATGDPDEVLKFLENNASTGGIYFLDANLSHEVDGITLAAKIREIDHRGVIIFITMHLEIMHSIFTYKLEVMDFILTNRPVELNSRICESLRLAYERLLKR